MDKIQKMIKKIVPKRIINAVRVLKYADCGFIGNPTYSQDGLVTNHICHFMDDPKFQESYRLATDHPSLTNYIKMHWRVYIACWAASKVKHLEGDFVECGVDRGVLSRAIVHYVDFIDLKKKFYLFDTFEGIPLENVSEEEKSTTEIKKRQYANTYDIVKERFRNFSNVILVKGKVPETLNQVNFDKISYLSLDMNNANPEIAAAEFFWDKLISGGVIVLDDYAYGEKYMVQRREFDKFAVRKGIQVLTLPTGQGLIFKP